MDEITKLKAEAYDLVAKIQQFQQLLEEKNQQIVQAVNSAPSSTPKTTKTK